MRFIGIDPGKSGGIAVLDDSGAIVAAHRMPDTLRGILQLLQFYGPEPQHTRGALEYVRSRPGMASFATFAFARNYGWIEMALCVTNIPYYDVHPARWQRSLDCLTRGDKNISKARAAELWPAQKVTHAIADALLLAEWVRRSTVYKSKGTS